MRLGQQLCQLSELPITQSPNCPCSHCTCRGCSCVCVAAWSYASGSGVFACCFDCREICCARAADCISLASRGLAEECRAAVRLVQSRISGTCSRRPVTTAEHIPNWALGGRCQLRITSSHYQLRALLVGIIGGQHV